VTAVRSTGGRRSLETSVRADSFTKRARHLLRGMRGRGRENVRTPGREERRETGCERCKNVEKKGHR
jgi:hypothetical protein